MRELDLILTAWAECERRGETAVLATVVDVQGSAYRKPGARMLMMQDGQRVGSISGGCLEGDVIKKAWWWTESGKPQLRTYDTTSDGDPVWEFGLGCNGLVRVLLERLGGETTDRVVNFLNHCRTQRKVGILVTVIASQSNKVEIGERLLMDAEGRTSSWIGDPGLLATLELEAQAALRERKSRLIQHQNAEVLVEVIAPPVSAFIFGAGHDAMPLVRISKELGWHVTIADGRPAYAQRQRFPLADEVVLTTAAQPLAGLTLDPRSIAVVMNHNFATDRAVLGELLSGELNYIGVLGPRVRTEKMLAELGWASVPARVHAPVGLDLGGDTPEAIALSIVSEIQAVLAKRSGGMLRQRATAQAGDRRTLGRPERFA